MIKNSSITGSLYVGNAAYGEIPEVQITAHGPYGSMSTTSDHNGSYWFRNVGNGTYDLECSLEGYGSIKIYGIQVFGNDTAVAHLAYLNPLPDSKLRLPKFTAVSIQDDLFNISTIGSDCGNSDRAVRLFFSTDEDVSDESYQFTTVSTLFSSCEIQLYVYLPNTFKSGDLIYLVGYICTYEDVGYVNMYSGLQVFPTVSKDSRSDVLSFIMP